MRTELDPPENPASVSPGRVWSRKGPKLMLCHHPVHALLHSLGAGAPVEVVGGAAKGRRVSSSYVCLKSTVWCVFRAISRQLLL